MPPPTADYYFGAADREITMGDNEKALREARFKPRMGLNLDTVTMHTTVLGQEISLPVIAAPVGSLRNLWPRGEAVAAAAARGLHLHAVHPDRHPARGGEGGGQRPVLVPIVSGWRKDGAQEHRACATERLCGARADHRHAGRRRRLRDKRNGAETLINGTWTQSSLTPS